MGKTDKKFLSRVAFFATLLAFVVVILGAYTRLKDAGLGCPDWPGCYGHLVVPETERAVASAQKLYPNQPVEAAKAWAEMTHRYFAGTLVLLIAFIAIKSYIHNKNDKRFSLKIPFLLVGCIFFQAMLGMWTVTWQLLPLVVMGHLLGGMTITSLLWWFTLRTGKFVSVPCSNTFSHLRPWVIAGIVIVFIQIFLGGWTSANYASIICPDFPYCQGQWFPKMNFLEAFDFLRPVGQNYQGGILGATARITIQMTHRYWAFLTFTYLMFLGNTILFSKKTELLKNTMGIIFIFLGSQIFLGIMNIATQLYLPIAVTHNAVALLLLTSLCTLLYQTSFIEPQKTSEKHITTQPDGVAAT